MNMRISTVCTVVALMVTVMVFSMCSNPGNAFVQVDPETQHFVDEHGRTLIFHGVNTVYKLAPYHPPILDRFHSNDSLSVEDFKYLHDRWGMNVIRLHVAWEGLEIQRGVYNHTYLGVLEGIVKKANSQGVMVLLDMHQDLASNWFCGNGFPVWLTRRENFPKPTLLDVGSDEKGFPIREKCLKNAFFQYYFTSDVGRTFQELYDNVNGMQDSFIKFWRTVAERFKNYSNVLGYELINEPWAGDIFKDPKLLLERGRSDAVNLEPMYRRAHEAIREIDDKHIIFYGPAVSDIDKIGFTSGPGGPEYNDRQALSYHVYCWLADPKGDPRNKHLCKVLNKQFFKWRESASKKLGGGRFLTEFGALSDSERGVEELHSVLGEAEKRLHSWAYWQYKYYNDITTQVRPGYTESFFDEKGNLYEAKVKALARTYAQAICGVPTVSDFNPDTSQYKLSYEARNCSGQPTVIFLSEEYYYPEGFDVAVTPANSVRVVQKMRNYLHLEHNSSVTPGTTIEVIINKKP